MKLQGKKIYLDNIKPIDLVKVMEWKNDKDLAELILANYIEVTMQDVEEWYKRNSTDKNQELFGIYLAENRQLIGISRLMFINLVNRNAEFGIYIGERSYVGMGLGQEAINLTFGHGFKNLNLHKIFLKVDEKNVRAIKAYIKIGMVQEGILKEHHWVSNSFRNILLFSMFKSDFQSNLLGERLQ